MRWADAAAPSAATSLTDSSLSRTTTWRTPRADSSDASRVDGLGASTVSTGTGDPSALQGLGQRSLTGELGVGRERRHVTPNMDSRNTRTSATAGARRTWGSLQTVRHGSGPG